MSHDALRLTRLHVRRAPGIGDGGFVLDALSDGVNVVFGPNGSGKTTTAAAIEAALWPAAAAGTARTRASVAARYHFAGAAWGVEVEDGRMRAQRDGHDASPPALPRDELRHRYRLHLHELLLVEHAGRDFAAEIMRESAGGYDLPGAAARLGLASPSPRGSAESRALTAARAELARVQEVERALRGDVERLGALEARLETARTALERRALLDAALAHARLRAALDEARAALAPFDERALALAGDEAERIEALGALAAEARRHAADATARVREADERLARARPGGAPPDSLVHALRAGLAQLDELRPQVASAEAALTAAAEACEGARRAIGDDVPEARLATVDLAALGDLSQWARDAGAVRAERLAAERELADLDDGTMPAHPADAVVRGMAALEGWLAAPEPGAGDARPRHVAIATAVLAVVAAALLAVMARASVVALAAAGVVALVALALLAIALRRDTVGDARAGHAGQYTRSGLPQPAAWERAAVLALLDELRELAGAAREAERRRERRAAVERRRRELEPQDAEVERRRTALVERLGVAPGTDAASIPWLLDRIGRWQDARVKLGAARAALSALRERQAAARDDVAARLAPFAVVASPASDAGLRGAVEALAEGERSHAAAQDALRLAERDLAAANAELARIAGDRRAILHRVGLTDGDEPLLARWTATLDAHRAAGQRSTLAEAQLGGARAEMERMPGFTAALLDLPAGELESRRAAADAEASELGALHREVGVIRHQVERARAGSDVERALAAVARAEGALRAACERDAEAAVGAALVRHLQEATRDQQRPPVFRRARELFLRVTHGRWRLDLEEGEGDAPSFRARDSHTGTGHALDELSSATRVQLLLCVRLAFVETQEREQGGARLPLLLDETLGTCDDARARAVIEAVLELARDGRQIFYFTAQWDEVEKWHAVRDTHDVPVAIHHLERARPAARLHVARPVKDALPRPALPALDGLDHAACGLALRVPAIARDAESVGGVHLWHLVDDVALLRHLLGLRVETWGALRELVEHGGVALLDGFPDAWARIRAAARALEAAHRAARQGHGRRVDRGAIAGSGAVSDTFLDRVASACEACDGDAGRLVALLEQGHVARFREESARRLRDHLVQHGYLSVDAPLSPEQVARRALAAVATELNAGLLSPDQVDRLVAAVLPPGASGGELPVAHLGLAGAAARATPPEQD